MKILVVGDLHFKKDNGPLMEILCQEILQVLDTQKPDLCVHLGDTLDTHERLHIRPVTAASNFLLECAKRCKVILLIGNHDRENNSDFQTNIHPFNGLKYHPNICVVDHTIWDRDLNFIYVPYVPAGRFREALESAGWTLEGEQPLLGFAHQEFRGAADGSHVSTSGDSWAANNFQIISGHYHQYHHLPGVIYVGTPIQHKFGDSSDNALLLVHLEGSKGERTFERIPLTSVEKKIVVYLTPSDLDNFWPKIPPGHQIKVFLTVNDSEASSIQKDPRYLSLCNSVQSVVIKTINTKLSLAGETLAKIDQENQMATHLETVVLKLLEDDPLAQKIFLTEILGIPGN